MFQIAFAAYFSETKVNGILCLNEEDIVVGIGEVIDLEIKLVCSANGEFHYELCFLKMIGKFP